MSPATFNVAVDARSFSYPSVPTDDAFNTPIFAITTDNESDPFAVNVFVNVLVFVPVVCAYVACARTSPPPPVVISPGRVVFAADSADEFADRHM